MIQLLASVVLITLARCVVASLTTELDPCDPSVYSELNEPHRSIGFETLPPHKPLCDINLRHGWYRFTSQAGGSMPTRCPEMSRCGTVMPLWMKGDHPNITDGIVTRQACGNFSSSRPQDDDPCCDTSIDIMVKNCSFFNVYYLSPIPECPAAYCAGEIAPCPVGQWSVTNFPPCRDAYPLLTVSPILHGPTAHSNHFYFQCEITYNISDSEQVFEVNWTFDGVQDPNVPPQELTDPSRTATLDGTMLQGHINSKLDCRVRAFYLWNKDSKSNWSISNSHYAGLQVSPDTLTVSEGELSRYQYVTVISTIPVICSHDVARCCLTFRIHIEGNNDALITNSCTYEMCTNDWSPHWKISIINILVVANQDFVTDGNKDVLLTFEELTSAGGGPYMDVFHRYRPNQVHIVVDDEETFTCRILGGCQMKSFDGQSYSMHLLGDFTAYQVPDRHFKIQIRTWSCWYGTCICGIVIREQNDIIRIDQCDQISNGPHTSPIIEIGDRPLREGVVIQRSRDGSAIAVYLLSGTQVKVECRRTHLSIYITGPGFDKNKARGVCGTYDGNPNNEFTYPNGTVEQTVSDDFFNAWRAGLTDSMFEVLPEDVTVDDKLMYCTCNNHDQTVTCSDTASAAPLVLCYHRCINVTDGWNTTFGEGGWSRKKREAVYGDLDVYDKVYDLASVQSLVPTADPNQQWPNVDGITEAHAKEMCTRAIESSQLHRKCGESGSSMTAEFMEACLSDILNGGTTEFVDAAISALTSSCRMDLAKGRANYLTSPEGKNIIKPEYLNDICDLECDKHGRCGEKGICVCDNGWEGYNCHIQSGIGPQVDRIRSGPLCDLAQRPCQRIFLDVFNVDLSDDFTCRVQRVDDQNNNIGRPIDTEANFLSGFRIACALPETKVSSQVYKVSASNDGRVFGNQVSLHVFNSACLDCNEARCREKTTACHIDDVCYRDGAIHVDNPLKVCDVSKDTSHWTKTACRNFADIIFVIDASGSIGQSNFAQQLSFLSNMTKYFALGPDNARFGAVVFESNAQKLFDLKDYSDHTSLANAITSASYTAGDTNTAAALNLVVDQNMFAVASGGRHRAIKIVIVITDGHSDSRIKTVTAAQRLKNAGVQLISIGVGYNFQDNELEQMASGPEKVFKVSGFDVLSRFEENVTKQTCSPAQNS